MTEKAPSMATRKARIQAEATALWRELSDEPPPAQADAGQMIDMMLSRLPEVGYDGLASPHLRRSSLSSWRSR
jgi:hypothetical protein